MYVLYAFLYHSSDCDETLVSYCVYAASPERFLTWYNLFYNICTGVGADVRTRQRFFGVIALARWHH